VRIEGEGLRKGGRRQGSSTSISRREREANLVVERLSTLLLGDGEVRSATRDRSIETPPASQAEPFRPMREAFPNESRSSRGRKVP
jgi:hypothetical protein